MRHSTYGVFVWLGILALCTPQSLVARDEKPAELKPVTLPDLSQFPTLEGKLDPVLGRFGTSFVPPRGGETFKLDLKEVPKLRALLFDEQRQNNVAAVAIPSISLPGPLLVESVHYNEDGSFLCMTIVARAGRASVTLEIATPPEPRKGEKKVLVWLTARSEHGVVAVARIVCQREGEFPRRP